MLSSPLAKEWFGLVRQTGQNWVRHDPLTHSAATAFYAIFSLPGLLIIVMAVAALFVEHSVAEAEIIGHVTALVGAEAAATMERVIAATRIGGRDAWALAIGLVTLFLATTRLFAQLQRSLNNVWDITVPPSRRPVKYILDRAVSFGLIVIIGFLLLISLVVTAVLNAAGAWLSGFIPLGLVTVMQWLDFAVSLGLVTLLFGLMFKFLPDARVLWRHALAGGLVSATFFNGGEYALNAYLAFAEPASAFGAAGTVILVMIWVSYSCLVLLLGAEFCRTLGLRRS